MQRHFLEKYSQLESPVHRLDSRVKIILALVFVVTVVSTPVNHILSLLVYAGVLSWIVALAGIPGGYILKRAALVLPFSVFAAMWIPLFVPGEKILFFNGHVELSVPGLWLFAGVVTKSFLGACSTILLVSATPFDRLINGIRKLKAPAILVDLFALTYRYLFVMVEEALRIRRAAAVRGYKPKWLGQAVLIGRMIGKLFVRSFQRSERVYAAMVLRGFSGRMPTAKASSFRWTDMAVLLVLAFSFIVVRIFVR